MALGLCTVLVGVAALAWTTQPSFLGVTPSPSASAAATGLGSAASASASPRVGAGQTPAPNPTPAASPRQRPTGGLEPELAARVDSAGLIARGGLWALRQSRLALSPDGQTWTGLDVPTEHSADAIFALDAAHLWVVDHPPEPATDQRPRTVVRGTADGGRTWIDADATDFFHDPGECYFGLSVSPFDHPLFADPENGFLAHQAPCRSDEVTILRTGDGGATWSPAGSLVAKSPDYVVSDARTLWAVSLAAPFLQVSRDAGSTWAAIELPSLSSDPASTRRSVAALRFFSSSSGVIAVVARRGGAAAYEFFTTSDGGRTWLPSGVPAERPWGSPPALADATHWVTLADFGTLRVTDDGGSSWRNVKAEGLPFLQWEVRFTDRQVGYTIPDWDILAVDGRGLYVTPDGGSTWSPAFFGDAIPQPADDPDTDWLRAMGIAETLGHRMPDGDIGWRLLSDFSRQRFGSEPAFRAAEEAYLAARHSTSISKEDVTLLDAESGPRFGALWQNVVATADPSRAFLVVIRHDPPSRERMVVAPLKDGSGLRIWIVSQT